MERYRLTVDQTCLVIHSEDKVVCSDSDTAEIKLSCYNMKEDGTPENRRVGVSSKGE